MFYLKSREKLLGYGICNIDEVDEIPILYCLVRAVMEQDHILDHFRQLPTFSKVETGKIMVYAEYLYAQGCLNLLCWHSEFDKRVAEP